MKYIVKITLTLIAILTTNSAFAIEKNNINPSPISNTFKNIQQAKLIEKEALKFKEKLTILQKNYLLEHDVTIKKSFKDLNEIIYILQKIQTTRIHKDTADKVIKIVINDLKKINTTTKSHLRGVKSNFLNERKKYDDLSLKLAKNLDSLISLLAKHYSKKGNLNSTDKEILLKVQSIQKKAKQLKNFSNIIFKNNEEVKSALSRILKGLRNNFTDIKNLSK